MTSTETTHRAAAKAEARLATDPEFAGLENWLLNYTDPQAEEFFEWLATCPAAEILTWMKGVVEWR